MGIGCKEGWLVMVLTPFVQVNTLEKGHDTNVSGVWREGVSGAGVTIAVVDDGECVCARTLMVVMLPWQHNTGVERLNPDLIENYVSLLIYTLE